VLAGRTGKAGEAREERFVMAATIFERYGGFASVSRVVSSFYDKMVESPATRAYFKNTDMRRLIDHQTKFIAYLMGGPASYADDHLERVHAHLGITDAAFRQAVQLLDEALEEHDVSEDDRRAVRQELNSRKSLIVTRP
jgi:hemoglobin